MSIGSISFPHFGQLSPGSESIGLFVGSQLFRGMEPILLRRSFRTASFAPELVSQSGYVRMVECDDAMLIRPLLMDLLSVQVSSPGVLQGTYSYVLQDESGQISATHSVSAGLDYPSIGPEHAWLKDTRRAEYVSASDKEALAACTTLARTEGIIPALESAHAVAEVIKRAPKMKKSDVVIVNISGRGDKDIGILRENLKLD